MAGRSLAHTCPEAPKGFQQPPYTTSTELLAYIRAETPADRQQRVTDLFERISFYDNRVLTASAQKRADATYDVTLTQRQRGPSAKSLRISPTPDGEISKPSDVPGLITTP